MKRSVRNPSCDLLEVRVFILTSSQMIWIEFPTIRLVSIASGSANGHGLGVGYFRRSRFGCDLDSIIGSGNHWCTLSTGTVL